MQARELDRDVANATGGAVNQHGLPGLNPRARSCNDSHAVNATSGSAAAVA